MTIYLSLLVALVGVLLELELLGARMKPFGIPTFFAGLLAFLLGFAGHAVSVIR